MKALVVIAALCGAGCASVQGPQEAAATAATAEQRLELRGYAIERSFNIVLEDALVVASNWRTEQSVRAAIQRASAAGTEVVDQLSDALAEYAVERAKFDANQSTAERLAVVAQNLDGWVGRGNAALIALQGSFR
jgi:hypothetical protein